MFLTVVCVQKTEAKRQQVWNFYQRFALQGTSFRSKSSQECNRGFFPGGDKIINIIQGRKLIVID